jgi:hypothetical protein
VAIYELTKRCFRREFTVSIARFARALADLNPLKARIKPFNSLVTDISMRECKLQFHELRGPRAACASPRARAIALINEDVKHTSARFSIADIARPALADS